MLVLVLVLVLLVIGTRLLDALNGAVVFAGSVTLVMVMLLWLLLLLFAEPIHVLVGMLFVGSTTSVTTARNLVVSVW